MIVNIILIAVFVISSFFTIVAMYAAYQYHVSNLAPFVPASDKVRQEKIARALVFVERNGGVERVKRGVDFGIQYGGYIAILSFFVIILRLIFP